MPDKEPGNKHLVNLHGIRFHITGDPTSNEAQRRIYLAKLDIVELKSTHPNLAVARFERPGLYKIMRTHGINNVSMTIPEMPKKEEKKKVRKREEEAYRFVPAICLATAEEKFPPEYWDDAWWCYWAWVDVVDISVCSSPEWLGQLTLIKEASTTIAPFREEEPGATFTQEGKEGAQILASHSENTTIEVLACTNWGNKYLQWYFNDDEDLERNTESDTLFVPGPGVNYGYDSNGAKDHMIKALVDKHSPVYFGPGELSGPVGQAADVACHDYNITNPPWT